MARVLRRKRKHGYIALWDPTHPLADSVGYVYEHRKMAWDAGLFDDPSLYVHHRNEVKDDNRLENLEVLTAEAHTRLHAAERGTITNQFGTFTIQEHSRAAYVRGCRCPICTRANTDYCRDQSRKRRERRGNHGPEVATT